MIRDVTELAIVQLLLLADSCKIPQDKVIFKIEGKMRMPSQLIWFITPDTVADNRYIPVQVKGLNFAVEHNGGLFLTNAVIDYKEALLHDSHLYSPTTTHLLEKPVWPRGFVFRDQITQTFYT